MPLQGRRRTGRVGRTGWWLLLGIAWLVAAGPLAAASPTGQVNAAIVSLHRTPSVGAEVVTQAFLGEPLRVLQNRGVWLKVALPEQFGYEGWIEKSVVHLGPASSVGDRVEVKRRVASIRERPSAMSPIVTAAYLATALPTVPDAPHGWTAVRLPDGRTGFLLNEDVGPIPAGRPTADAIVAVAREYLRVPYVWGGMSTHGVDCSGFSHTVYRFNGIRLHRDADQQFDHDGRPVALKDLRAGDLVFFKTYLKTIVSHVGIYLGHGRFIHASTRLHGVAISRLSESYFARRYAGARRILDNP